MNLAYICSKSLFFRLLCWSKFKNSYFSNQLFLSINVNNTLSFVTNELFIEMMIFTQLVKKLPNLI